MAKKVHRSARGLVIDFDALERLNPDVVAVGNANLNARGDQLGKGGKIIRKVSDIPEYQRPDPNAAYNQDNPNAVRQVSIKSSIDNFLAASVTGSNQDLRATFTEDELSGKGAKTPQEAIKELAKRNRPVKETKESSKSVKETKESSKPKRKLVDTDE